MLREADLILDKTKESVKAHKRGYLKGFEEGLAAGRREPLDYQGLYDIGYHDGFQAYRQGRKEYMREYMKAWRKSKRG